MKWKDAFWEHGKGGLKSICILVIACLYSNQRTGTTSLWKERFDILGEAEGGEWTVPWKAVKFLHFTCEWWKNSIQGIIVMFVLVMKCANDKWLLSLALRELPSYISLPK